MIKIYKYNLEKYNIISMLESLFDRKDLQNLHRSLDEEYAFFDKPGIDSDTKFHNIFYDRMRTGWPEFLNLYKKIIKDVVAPTLDIEDQIIYQKWPSFRIHLPNNVAVGGWHKDEDYSHPPGEINFILPVTRMFESNATIAETSPGKMDFRQLTASPGEIIKFNGNQCMHGNLPNTTGVSRVSLDFRVMHPKDYNPKHLLKSLSKGNKFLIGEYYEILDL